jgi:hypothetical protein
MSYNNRNYNQQRFLNEYDEGIPDIKRKLANTFYYLENTVHDRTFIEKVVMEIYADYKATLRNDYTHNTDEIVCDRSSVGPKADVCKKLTFAFPYITRETAKKIVPLILAEKIVKRPRNTFKLHGGKSKNRKSRTRKNKTRRH